MADADWAVFRWLNGQAGDHPWLDRLGEVAATDLALVIVVTIMAGWLVAATWHLWRQRQLPRSLLMVVLVAGASLAVGLGVNQVISKIWFRPRPYDSHRGVHLLVSRSGDPSFPSDHATAGFVLSLSAIRALPRTGALVLVETVLLSVGRVFVGLHYPGDILGSLAVAAVVVPVMACLANLAAGPIDRATTFVNAHAQRRGWPLRLG
jgi:undecaprenyl-diphosphatase